MTTTYKKTLVIAAIGSLIIVAFLVALLVYARGALSPVEATELFYTNWVAQREARGESPLLFDLHRDSLYPTERLENTLQEARTRAEATGFDPVLCGNMVPRDVLVDAVELSDTRASLVVVLQYDEPVRVRVLATRKGDWWLLDEIDCLDRFVTGASPAASGEVR